MPLPTNTFSADALTQAVNHALATQPLDHNGASVSVSTQEGVTVVIAEKINNHWTVVGQVDRPPAGKIGAEVHSSWTW